eukprot:239184-Pyramimonas_sp.AAC.1
MASRPRERRRGVGQVRWERAGQAGPCSAKQLAPPVRDRQTCSREGRLRKGEEMGKGGYSKSHNKGGGVKQVFDSPK